jgi:hypothetical protein
MPRFHRRRAPRMPKQPRVPKTPRVKKPKAVKIPRPKVKALRMMLKGLLTVSQANRIASLAYALQWYDQALPYMVQKGQLDVKAKKLLEIAVKCRKLGIGATNDHEKETSFATALRQYEKACVVLRPALVDKYYDQLKVKESGLQAKQQKLENKFGNVIGLLQKAIGNRIKLTVADAQKPFQYDPGLTSVTYNREAARGLAEKFRAEGILAVVLDQMPILVQHAALQQGTGDQAGTWVYDPARHVAINDEIMQSFLAFAKTADAPNKLVRNGVVREPKIKQPKAPCATCQGVGTIGAGSKQTPCPDCAKAPKAPRVFTKGPRILGFLVPGTAIATVYDRLMDEKEHDIKDIIAGLATGDPVGRIKQLGRYGVQKNVLDLTINGQKVSIKHKPGVTPGERK